MNKTVSNKEICYSLGSHPNFIGKCIVILNIYNKQVFVKHLFVDKKYRGCGYGKQILDFVEDDLKKIGYTSVSLNAQEDTERSGKLQKFYTDLGYKFVVSRFIDVDGCTFKLISMIKYL